MIRYILSTSCEFKYFGKQERPPERIEMRESWRWSWNRRMVSSMAQCNGTPKLHNDSKNGPLKQRPLRFQTNITLLSLPFAPFGSSKPLWNKILLEKCVLEYYIVCFGILYRAWLLCRLRLDYARIIEYGLQPYFVQFLLLYFNLWVIFLSNTCRLKAMLSFASLFGRPVGAFRPFSNNLR